MPLVTVEVKVLTHRAALFVAQELFEATGVRLTRAAFALDRFQCNARMYTLHDPLDCKLHATSRYTLEGILPDAIIYG